MSELPSPIPFIVKLTRGYETIVDTVDADLAMFKWCVSVVFKPYAAATIKSKDVRLHRVVMERILGRPLAKGEVVDHIDGNSLDNRRSNLRVATNRQNIQNSKRSKRNSTGFKGVTFQAGKTKPYRAQIMIDGKKLNLGNFKTPQEAHEIYCQTAKRHFGEFSKFE